MSSTTTKKARILSVEKAVNILNLFKDEGRLSLNEISTIMNIPKTTAFGLIATLENLNMLELDNDSGKYELGTNIIELSIAKKSNFKLEQEALKILKKMSDKYSKNTHITMLSGNEIIYVDSIVPTGSMASATVIGAKAPANCTSSGKAFLASLSEKQLDAVLGTGPLTRLTDNSITDVEQLKKELKVIKERGYAVDNQESIMGIRGVGAVVTGAYGNPVLGISIAGLTSYIDDADIAKYSAEIARAAKYLSANASGSGIA